MRICLLAHHPDNFTGKRLQEELKGRCHVIRPHEVRWSYPASKLPQFDVTFNRLSTVESGGFERAISKLSCWGRQTNPWELREALWDKAHQAMWLSQKDVAAVPSFMHRGPLTPDDPAWRSFAQLHGNSDQWVLKFNRGQRGVGVHFLNSEQELFAWLETLRRMNDQDFLVQPRLQHGAEGRLIMLNGEPWAWLARQGMRANFAQGGEAHEVLWKDAPQDIKTLATKLSLAGTFLAIDVWLGDQLQAMDVNTVPGVEQLEQVTQRNFTRDLVQVALKS